MTNKQIKKKIDDLDNLLSEEAVKKIGRKNLLTDYFYKMKDEYITYPYISLVVVDGKVTGARLVLPDIEYFFHNTKHNNLELPIHEEDITTLEGKKAKKYRIYFDGWGMNINK